MSDPGEDVYAAAAQRIDRLTEPGHDYGCATAIWNQARNNRSQPLDEVQVEHLLQIGYRAGRSAGVAAGRAQAAADIRATAPDWRAVQVPGSLNVQEWAAKIAAGEPRG